MNNKPNFFNNRYVPGGGCLEGIDIWFQTGKFWFYRTEFLSEKAVITQGGYYGTTVVCPWKKYCFLLKLALLCSWWLAGQIFTIWADFSILSFLLYLNLCTRRQEAWDFCLCYSLLFSQCLKQCQAHSRYSFWRNECIFLHLWVFPFHFFF